jgi:hypothetical protein
VITRVKVRRRGETVVRPAGQVRDVVVQPPEQLMYARLLEAGARLGLVVLVLTFVAYAFGLIGAHVAPDRLPDVWSLPVDRYLEQTQQVAGWSSLLQVGFGDAASLWGIVILSTCSVVCLLALVPGYWTRGDTIFVFLCLAEVAVIVLAASGWLAGGH